MSDFDIDALTSQIGELESSIDYAKDYAGDAAEKAREAADAADEAYGHVETAEMELSSLRSELEALEIPETPKVNIENITDEIRAHLSSVMAEWFDAAVGAAIRNYCQMNGIDYVNPVVPAPKAEPEAPQTDAPSTEG